MSIFKRRTTLPVERISVPDEWSMFRGQYQSKPLIARLRKPALKLAGHPSYAHQVGIAVPLNRPDNYGFPTREEADQLNHIEDLISSNMQSDNESILVGVISTNSMREFVLYTTNPEAVTAKFGIISKAVTTHMLQLMIQPDKDWSVIRSLAK